MIELIKTTKEKLEFTEPVGGGTPITVDSELSTSSTNPVQNKVITEKINEIESDIDALGANHKSPWEGKTAVFFGDSLTEKNGWYSKGYHQWVKEILGLSSYTNYGISIYTLKKIYNKIKSTNTPADIVFVMGGVNDQTYSVNLGAFGDKTENTSYGALALMCQELREKYPTSTVIFITPHYQTKYPHNEGITSYEISKAIKEVCERYAIAVYDNYALSEIFASNFSTYTTDNCHWNNKAHEMVGKNLAKFVLNTFPNASTYTTPRTDWIGRKIVVEKNSNNTSNTCHLVALVAVDDDMKTGNTITTTLKATDATNVIARVSTGGNPYYDNTGEVNTPTYTKMAGTSSTGATIEHTLTVVDGEMTLTTTDRVVSAEPDGATYMKVPFLIAGTAPYSFKISDISVKVNGKEKPILALGSWYDSTKEVVKVCSNSELLFNIEDNSSIQTIDSEIVDINLINNDGKEFRYKQDIVEINIGCSIPAHHEYSYDNSISFTTGATIPTVVCDGSSICWSGTDVVNNAFTPKANTRYTIAFWWDGSEHNAVVRGVLK